MQIQREPIELLSLLKDIKNSAENTAPVKSDYKIFGSFYDSTATSTIDRRYEKYLKKSGVKKIVLHDFRLHMRHT
ncbi:hypothetical protein [Bacillus sp. V26]|uniref:hypothetical protein n=1 Tax=Bacillus sp. V26 TaxID=3098288 RepID=UPI002ABE7C2B|nr:hypothetical protein [Bacillus sp. V26]